MRPDFLEAGPKANTEACLPRFQSRSDKRRRLQDAEEGYAEEPARRSGWQPSWKLSPEALLTSIPRGGAFILAKFAFLAARLHPEATALERIAGDGDPAPLLPCEEAGE